MKYSYQTDFIPTQNRRELNDKVLYLIDSGEASANSITPEDLFNAYTGDGGLHQLNRSDYDNYSKYSQAKKEVENGQFFTPPVLCEFIIACLKISESDIVADLTCGMGNFFNFLPVESNLYGCELDIKAYKVAHYLYPAANLEHKDIRLYQPNIRFDYVVGNPPFHLRWWMEDGTEILSQLFYCQKAAALLKPYGILALIVPKSFLADNFTDGTAIKEMEACYRFLGQVALPTRAFEQMGVVQFPTKLQFWQRRPKCEDKAVQLYRTEYDGFLSFLINPEQQAVHFHNLILNAKADLETNRSRILLELAQNRNTSNGFQYQVEKSLYHIKVHPATKERYTKCCEYLHRFYTETQPEDMPYLEWSKVRLTEKKVLSYLTAALKRQNKKPERDKISLVKQSYNFVYKAYSAKTRRQLTHSMSLPVPIYHAVLENTPDRFPGYERLLRRKRQEYEIQSQKFSSMTEDKRIAAWLSSFTLWDSENREYILLNNIQRHDLNLILQKRYGLLQWEQGSGKTLAGIAVGLYRMKQQHIHSTWVISSAISIRNNWLVVLPNYGISYVFIERLSDLDKIRPGDFVLLTLNKVSKYKKQLRHWLRLHGQKIQLVFDESDEITNPGSVRTKASLTCFRRCRYKLLTTGTSTRNNISEFAPQQELLYNNSINMISWCKIIYHYDQKSGHDGGSLTEYDNPYYGEPIPAYQRGYLLFTSSHLPEKITVFGVGQRTQDIFNANILSEILEKTVITRTFEEVSGKNIKHIHQMPLRFSPEEKSVYQTAIDEFYTMRDNYFESTGNSRKDSMMKLIQQIVLLLRISAAPDTVLEYKGDTPVKIMAALELAADFPDEVVVIGVRHKVVLDSYAKAIQEYLPDRPLFVVTGSTTTFAKRRALRKTLKESQNGILLCTQQSLPSSVNFEFVNKIIIPELHYNNSGMSQFYFRFIRYTSMEDKDIYFLTYAGSIESNLMQMILVKEKLNLFMKGQDADLNAIYERFDIDYDLLSLLMYKEKDENGAFHIRWGEQTIA